MHVVVLPTLLWLTGCVHAQFIMDYDDVVDHGLMQVQTETEQFLGQLEADAGTPKASYENSQAFYVRTAAELNTLRTRLQFEPKSTEVVTQVNALQKTLGDLQTVQKGGSLNAMQIEYARRPLESQFSAIARLQLALRNKPYSKSSVATAPTIHP